MKFVLSTLKPLLIGTVIGAVLLSLLSAIFQAVVGDIAVSTFHTLLDKLERIQGASQLFWMCTLAFIITLILFFFYHRQRLITLKADLTKQHHLHTHLHAKLESLKALFTLEEAFLRLLPSLLLADTSHRAEALHLLMGSLLLDAMRVLDVHGASLYLPDLAKEELKIWEAHGISARSMKRATCYIGPSKPDRKVGVAGEAFLKQRIIITHRIGEKGENGNWKFDHESYIHFANNGISPPYQSLACVPLLNESGAQKSLGVICLNSSQKETFDTPEVQENLILIGRCFTSALLVYQEISRGQPLQWEENTSSSPSSPT